MRDKEDADTMKTIHVKKEEKGGKLLLRGSRQLICHHKNVFIVLLTQLYVRHDCCSRKIVFHDGVKI